MSDSKTGPESKVKSVTYNYDVISLYLVSFDKIRPNSAAQSAEVVVMKIVNNVKIIALNNFSTNHGCSDLHAINDHLHWVRLINLL